MCSYSAARGDAVRGGGAERDRGATAAAGGTTEVMASVNGAVEWPVAPDTQASSTIMTENTLGELNDETEIEVIEFETKRFHLADNRTVECNKKATLELVVKTSTSPVRLRRVTAYVFPGDLGAILLGMVFLTPFCIQRVALLMFIITSESHEFLLQHYR